MYRKLIEESKVKMEKTRDFYQQDMLSLRAGRANPQILDKIGTTPVVNIGRAFAGSSVTEVTLPKTIRHIGTEAFFNCSQLRDLKLSVPCFDTSLDLSESAENAAVLEEVMLWLSGLKGEGK